MVTATGPAVAAGVLSLLATTLDFLAAHEGMLTVAAVLASVYLGVTVGLAAVLLHERPSRRQLWAAARGSGVVLIVLG